MKKYLPLLFLIGMFTTGAAIAQSAETHPIDQEIINCKTQNSDQAGIIGCDFVGYQKWFVEMERRYNLLMGKLDDKNKLILKEQQVKWRELHDLTLEMNNKIFSTKENGIFIISSNKTDIVRRRALEIQSYLDMLP